LKWRFSAFYVWVLECDPKLIRLVWDAKD